MCLLFTRAPRATRAIVASLSLSCWVCCSRGSGLAADASPVASRTSKVGTASIPTPERETAALLVVDDTGVAKTVCLPALANGNVAFPGTRLAKLLDVTSSGQGLVLAAVLAPNSGASTGGGAVLLLPDQAERPLGDHVQSARFSFQGDALLMESVERQHVGGGIMTPLSTSALVDLSTGKTESLGAVTDPRWEADGRHVRATRLRKELRDRRTRVTADWRSTRIRWDRASKVITELGPGSSQIPAPHGQAVAWSDEPLRSILNERCTLSLGDGEHVQSLPAAGRVCQGSADDRGTRWSADGKWLALTGLSGAGQPLVLDIVSATGQRHPALGAALATAGRPQVAKQIVAFPWIDWSASGERLVVQDPAGLVTLFDLPHARSIPLGAWNEPQLSPHGDLVLVREVDKDSTGTQVERAFVISSRPETPKISLGHVRDARWIDSGACVAGKGH